MNTTEDRFTTEQIMEVERRTRNAAHSHEYSGTTQQAKRYRETAAILRQASSDTARIAELTTEVADLKSKLDFANAMNADQDKTVAGLTAEVTRYKDALSEIVEEVHPNVVDPSAGIARAIARNALKDGV